MTDPFIVLDIDGTLLDEAYGTNDPALGRYIDSLAKRQYAFCINSNRAIEDLLPVAAKFHITGPIIGENGIFAYMPASQTTHYFLPKKDLNHLKSAKHRFEVELQKKLQALLPQAKIYWQNIDTVSETSRPHKTTYPEGSIVVQNNQFRDYTVSAHIKQYRHGRLSNMHAEASALAARLDKEIGDKLNLNVSYSSKFANVLASTRLASKRTALEKLIDILGNNHSVYVIGDEMSDYEMSTGIGTFMTTANAAKKVKDVARIYASEKYARGVRELLGQIEHEHISQES